MKNKGVVYIRRLKTSDKTNSIFTAFEMVGRRYGVFRHGLKADGCLAAGDSKRALKLRFSKDWKSTKKFFKEVMRKKK